MKNEGKTHFQFSVLGFPVLRLRAKPALGIACAATLCGTENAPRLWHGQDDGGRPAPRMAREEAADLVNALSDFVDDGFTILTWNGLGFDFDILAEESGMPGECSRLARSHVDMMFHAFCDRGFPIGLDRAAQTVNWS